MEYTELSHLEGKEPVVSQIYERLICELQKFGPIKIDPKKTSIHLSNRFGFCRRLYEKGLYKLRSASQL